VKTLNKVINPSLNTNPFNHNTNYIKLYTSMKDGTSDKDEFGQYINPRYLDDVFNFATSMPPLTRKVRVDLGRKELLVMREVQVFDYNNINRASGKPATQSTLYNGGNPASNAVDGNFDSVSHTDNNIGKYHRFLSSQSSRVSCFIDPPLLTSHLRFYLKSPGGR
jgi:hypothetical protein